MEDVEDIPFFKWEPGTRNQKEAGGVHSVRICNDNVSAFCYNIKNKKSRRLFYGRSN